VIQLQNSRFASTKLDCRVKPGNDEVGVASAENQPDSRGSSPAMTQQMMERLAHFRRHGRTIHV
jgi:hypothetical protein